MAAEMLRVASVVQEICHITSLTISLGGSGACLSCQMTASLHVAFNLY